MNLKNKLAVNSSLLFAFTVGLVMAGSFLLFRTHMKDLYYDNLEDHAMTTALFYFEKDEIKEINSARYRQIEIQYNRINNESIRVYDAKTKKLFVEDNVDFKLSDQYFNLIKKEKILHFKVNTRQFVGLFYKDNQGDFIIVVSGIDRTGNRQLEILGIMFILFYLAGIPINYLLGTFLAKQTFLPFEQVIAKVNTITTENLHSRLEIPQTSGKDEIKELVTTFNYLLERLESGIMIQNNFLKNASHELKTPLTIIIGDIDVSLQQPRTNEQYQQILKSLKKDTLHLKSTLEGLLVLSGLELSEPQQMESVRIDEVLWNVLEKKAIEYPEAKVSVNFDAISDDEDLLSIHGNKHMIFIALYNILDNAIKFSSPEQVNVFAFSNEGKLLIKITDQGPGISETDRESIFDLFFRSDRTRHIQGQGLGLFITMQILKLHNINLIVDSELEKGTTFSLVFP
ncbi:signal transduction histidine kinase [Flavobacterium sp. 90]|uniref:HAMP domain-containing sensor histidine kinase n=1 Tax=unclassified Flavobacterium TaxID=196869 RepID=UPI000F280853|nr:MULTISPECIES: HAMP domain-containing sensor histidine kinase [unclassified Flavobacterium]RKR11558.1 signal transduction histidine kinase [Flavobacterium sp. 81]TCK55339.1 signal transduction histidine kinase [Flavobacterium sp. 90]